RASTMRVSGSRVLEGPASVMGGILNQIENGCAAAVTAYAGDTLPIIGVAARRPPCARRRRGARCRADSRRVAAIDVVLMEFDTARADFGTMGGERSPS